MSSGATKPQAKAKFYAVCITYTNESILLITRAASEEEASTNIHKGYPSVHFIWDFISCEEHGNRRRKLRKSLAHSPNYL